MPAAGQIAVHDVKSRPIGQLRALEAEQRLERAMRPGGIVEQSGQRADDVVVVVEHLVVKATLTRMSFDEDGVGSVDHDLPDVGILQQDGERTVFGQVDERPLRDLGRIGDVLTAKAPAALDRPGGQLVGDQVAQGLLGSADVEIEGH